MTNKRDPEYHRRWRAANPDKVKAIALRDLERRRKYGREWKRKPENRAKEIARQKTDRGRESKWACKIKAKHGLTRQQHANILESQGGVCPGCGDSLTSRKHTHVDHDHSRSRVDGNIRGILCGHCNRALGAVRDRPDILVSLIRYLEVRPCGP